MARRNFPGETQEKLEEWLSEVNEDLATGQVITGTSSMDQSVSFQKTGNSRGRQTRILQDLFILDPDKYPLEDVIPINRTRGGFRQREVT